MRQNTDGKKQDFWARVRAKLGLTKGEKSPRGHNLLVKLNAKRSKRARTMDGKKTARHTFHSPTDENIQEWDEDPGHHDFSRIDTEGRHAGAEQGIEAKGKVVRYMYDPAKGRFYIRLPPSPRTTREKPPTVQGIPKSQEKVKLNEQVFQAINAAGMAGHREVGGGIYLHKDIGGKWADGAQPDQVLTLKPNTIEGAHTDTKAPIMFHTHHRDPVNFRTRVQEDYIPHVNDADLKQEVRDNIWDDIPSARDINTMKRPYASKKAMIIVGPNKVITLRNATRVPGPTNAEDSRIYAIQRAAVTLSDIELARTKKEVRRSQKTLNKEIETRIKTYASSVGVEVDFAQKTSPKSRFIKRV